MSDRIKHLTADTFASEILPKGITVVDFWATWCGPCKMLAPILEELSEELTEVKFCKVNVDDEMDLAMQYGVSSIPMLLYFKDGEPVRTSVGYEVKQAIQGRIQGMMM